MFRFLSRLVGRKATCPPSPACPHCSLLQQARELDERGYYIGAVATARCALESRIKETICAMGHDRPISWHGHGVAMFLHGQGLLSLSQARRVSAAVHISASMIRGAGRCHPVKSARMLREIEAVIAMLEKAPREAAAMAKAA